VTVKHVAFLITAALEGLIALAVIRDPRPRTLVLALAASVLVAFSFMTAMHERYSYGALVFLLLLLPEPRMRWLNLALGFVFTLNVLAAVPPTPEIEAVLRAPRWIGVLSAIAMLVLTGIVYAMVRRRSRA
jgi:hypothetical protein